MKRVLYSVIATLPDQATADEYVHWLEDGHVDAVVKAGAHSAMIVRLEGEGREDRPRVMTQYVFSTRAVFDKYIRDSAPMLRADGLKRFPSERGVTFSRTVGEIV